jgi:glucose-1-phosphate cytidylyltransferase
VKTVILAGGLGTRISEESHLRPKPMIEIGGWPILLHIMKIYAHHGLTDFIICLGYKGYVIKEYFANYILHRTDVTFDFARGETTYHQGRTEPWRVTLVDTGEQTNTGGRIARIRDYLDKDEPFCMTYGDGVANVDLKALIDFHKRQGLEATLTAIAPPGRYGALDLKGAKVTRFTEKPPGDDALINGGFFVAEPRVMARISGDGASWEREILASLAADGELGAYRHRGFWQAMDTLRDRTYLEGLWAEGNAPWKIWES